MNHKKLLPQMISLTLVLLLLVACTPQPTSPPTATPTPTPTTSSGEVETGNGEAPSPPVDGPASIDLDDPNWFNQPSNVETYRTSLEYTFSDADGSPAIGAVLVEGETVVDPYASNLVFQMEGNAAQGSGETLVSTQIGDILYVVMPDFGCISGPDDEIETPFDTFLGAGGDLTGEAYRVQPDENVNGVDVYVFEITLDNMENAVTDEITELKEGRIYIAKDGFYVVRMRFVVVGINEDLSGDPTLEGEELYELNYYDFNEPVGEIVPPEGCTDMGAGDVETEYPLPEDASNLIEMAGVVIFSTNLTLEEITEFYQTEMTAMGCSVGQEIGNVQGMMITFAGCPSGTVQVVIAPDPSSGVQEVSIIPMP